MLVEVGVLDACVVEVTVGVLVGVEEGLVAIVEVAVGVFVGVGVKV